ncbi:hypothetical protein MUN76_06000 [Leucobacter rhizosphaerae]|uniref:DUF222 domain-containing protein n=1 Tax=Leucobacter rhizosphaerae TaxID=2932245 RepID=A0ABY4FZJ8_9MICO|nr:hypothetical protein [Leucobacter rhizosphaerae]UOQ61514.1 hypothetical protein MUN76_06000 [Leucobacter rhizosphaerae]
MNPEHDPDVAEAARSRLHPALAAAMNAERTPPGGLEQAEAERAMLAAHRDPSLTRRTERDRTGTDSAEPGPEQAEAEQRTQIRWVRPTELAMRGGARATGWGLALRAELAQRLRYARAQHRAAEQGDRPSRLPDLSIRGRRNQARPEPARSGMGLR